VPSRLERLAEQASQSEQLLAARLQAPLQTARHSWLVAGGEASAYVRQVIAVNPTKSLQEILARPDVQEALTIPFEEANDATQAALQVAWSEGVETGRASAIEDLANVRQLLKCSQSPIPVPGYPLRSKTEEVGERKAAWTHSALLR
jgi:hypothetical protein